MIKQKSVGIESEIIKLVKKEAKKKKRSDSYVINEILKKHYKIK